MKWIILAVLLAETCALHLRGMYQQNRENIIEGHASEYFLKIYTETVLIASISDKYTNYSFYEYGCIPLRPGMVDNIGYNMNECDVHNENIQYYTTLYRKQKEILEGVGARYYQYNVLDDDLKHYHIETNEIMERAIQKIKDTFMNISIKKIRNNCCDEFTISW